MSDLDSGIILGGDLGAPSETDVENSQPETQPPPREVVTPVEFHAYMTNIGMIICFDLSYDKEGVPYWEMPLVLETVSQRDPRTNQVSKSQGFRPLVPLTKDTKFRPIAGHTLFAVEILDPQMEDVYRATAQEIRAQISGITLPKVGSGSPIING